MTTTTTDHHHAAHRHDLHRPMPASRLAGLWARPRVKAQLLYAAWMATTAVSGLIVNHLLPDWSGLARSFVAMMPLVVLSTILVIRVTGWQDAGFTRPRQWRELRLYALPTVVVLAPIAAGVTPVAPGMLAMLITGYALTGYMEEAMWRGVVLRVLRPTGTMQAVLIGSLLFGAAHLSNIMFRESAALVAAQALGSFCGGIGYAALRLRTNTIWPVMALHMAGDLIASIGALPKIPTLVTHDVIMLAFGLYLLRRNNNTAPSTTRPDTHTEARLTRSALHRIEGGYLFRTCCRRETRSAAAASFSDRSLAQQALEVAGALSAVGRNTSR